MVFAGSGLPEQAVPALERLCSAYWYPVYAYIRRKGQDAEGARDLTQEFFTRLVEKNYLSAADRSRGRFRSFLLMAVQRFLCNDYDRQSALRRGGHTVVQSLDAEDAEGRYRLEPSHQITPEAVFERRWALLILDRALTRVKSQARMAHIELLVPFLTGDAPRGAYETVAARLGMSEGALKVSVHRLRERFRESVRAEILDTVCSEGAIDSEIRYLMEVLGRSQAGL